MLVYAQRYDARTLGSFEESHRERRTDNYWLNKPSQEPPIKLFYKICQTLVPDMIGTSVFHFNTSKNKLGERSYPRSIANTSPHFSEPMPTLNEPKPHTLEAVCPHFRGASPTP